MKKVLKKIIALIILISQLTPMISFATNETETAIIIHTNTNTDVYNLGEDVQATVSWKSRTDDSPSYSDVQAIGFTLQYDKNKLEFVDATFNEVSEDATIHEQPLEEDFYNVTTPGTLILSKISLNDLDIYNINFNFKTTDIGDAQIKIVEVDCVANGNLVSPDVIDYTTNGLATIKTVAFGDVDLNGEVDIDDATLLGKYLEGTTDLTDQQLANADVNLDGLVDDLDVELIQKSLASVIALPIRYGDVDLNGIINNRDTAYLLNYLEGKDGYELNERAKLNSDTNLDGIINEIDSRLILYYKVGKGFRLAV